MSRNQIIEEIYNDKQYIDYCYKVCKGKDLHKDLFQYVVLYLMEMPASKLEAIHERGEIRMYVARIIYINANSNRSQFHKQYTNISFSGHSDSDIIIPEIAADEEREDVSLEKVESKIQEKILFCHQKNIYPASVKLLQIYAELGTYQAVAKATRIPYKTVRRHIQGITEEIRKSL